MAIRRSGGSSGLEDYFLGTYYFDTGRFYNDVAGLTHFDQGAKRFAAYRIHDDDPIFFSNGLRLTCLNWEKIHGGQGTNSRLSLTTDVAGEWRIVATAFDSDEMGDYTLTVRTLKAK